MQKGRSFSYTMKHKIRSHKTENDLRNRTEKALAQRGDLQKKSIGSCYLSYVTFKGKCNRSFQCIWGESGFKVKVMDDEFVILDLAWVLLA